MGTAGGVAWPVLGVLRGKPADGEFPNCVALGDRDSWCSSGVLVAPNVVLTAGYCAEACAHRVAVGDRVTGKVEGFRVRRVVVHPGRDPVTMKNDLALLI